MKTIELPCGDGQCKISSVFVSKEPTVPPVKRKCCVGVLSSTKYFPELNPHYPQSFFFSNI